MQLLSDHGANRLGALARWRLANRKLPFSPTPSRTISGDQDLRAPLLYRSSRIRRSRKAGAARQQQLLSIQGSRSVDSIHKELGHISGISWAWPVQESLTEAPQRCSKELRKTFETDLYVPGSSEGWNNELDKAFRLRDFITMGELMAYDALNRNESCGGHFREEYQTGRR